MATADSIRLWVNGEEAVGKNLLKPSLENIIVILDIFCGLYSACYQSDRSN